MCGIAGILHFKADASATPVNTEKILKLLKHRGPDNQSHVRFGSLELFHSRLSIVDTSHNSDQPFLDEARSKALVFNGEIYNYRELRNGINDLRTNGDVEVLFRLLEDQGIKALHRLNGFFAFAYYDDQRNSLLIARDRFGVKPLYYTYDKDRLVFASELKPLLELAGPQEIDEQQLYTYFRLNYCAGNRSIFRNVYRLLPGHFIEVKNGEVTVQPWYEAVPANQSGTLQQSSGQLATLLEEAVRLRLQADVPVGTFLSGGIDSSIISALARKHKPDLNTFSIGFEKEQFFDETRYSESVARHINSRHHVFRLSQNDFLEHLPAFLRSVDEPFADSSAFNFYMLSKYTRQYVKVALSGDGADELFKGYNKHRALVMRQHPGLRTALRAAGLVLRSGRSSRNGRWQNMARQLHKFNVLSGLSDTEAQQFLAALSTDAEVTSLLAQNAAPSYFTTLFQSHAPFHRFALTDSFDLQTVLCDDMLVKADRFSMVHGVEVRNPFLDYRVVEFALGLPALHKINGSQQKLVLRRAFSGLLPDEIFTRRKKGFELPLQQWLSGPLSSMLGSNYLNPERISDEGWLNASRVEQLQRQLVSTNPGDSAAQVWTIVVFMSWLDNFRPYIRTHA